MRRACAGVFSRAAATYDHVGPRFFTDFGCRLVALAGIARGARVLDVATGRGACLFPAAEQAGPEGHVTGIDLAEPMVTATAAEIRARGLAQAEVLVMGAEQLDFPDASFAVVLCGFGIFFLPDPWRALAEWRRVLRPGGRLALSTWGGRDERWRWLNDLLNRYLPREPGPESSRSPARPAPVFHNAEGLEALLGEAGFVAIDVLREEAEYIYASEDDWWQTQYSHAARDAMEEIEQRHGLEGLARFKGEAFAGLQTLRRPDGTIPQRWIPLYTVATKG